LWAFDLTDAGAVFEPESVCPADFAEISFFYVVGGLSQANVGAVLGSCLDDSVVFSGGLEHFSAFPDGVRGGLFDVNIFAGLAGPNSKEGVPMVGGGGGYGVYVLIFQELTDVGIGGDFFAEGTGLVKFAVEDIAVGIAEGDDADAGYGSKNLDVLCAFAAKTDDCDADIIVSTSRFREGGSQGDTCGK